MHTFTHFVGRPCCLPFMGKNTPVFWIRPDGWESNRAWSGSTWDRNPNTGPWYAYALDGLIEGSATVELDDSATRYNRSQPESRLRIYPMDALSMGSAPVRKFGAGWVSKVLLGVILATGTLRIQRRINWCFVSRRFEQSAYGIRCRWKLAFSQIRRRTIEEKITFCDGSGHSDFQTSTNDPSSNVTNRTPKRSSSTIPKAPMSNPSTRTAPKSGSGSGEPSTDESPGSPSNGQWSGGGSR